MSDGVIGLHTYLTYRRPTTYHTCSLTLHTPYTTSRWTLYYMLLFFVQASIWKENKNCNTVISYIN